MRDASIVWNSHLHSVAVFDVLTLILFATTFCFGSVLAFGAELCFRAAVFWKMDARNSRCRSGAPSTYSNSLNGNRTPSNALNERINLAFECKSN